MRCPASPGPLCCCSATMPLLSLRNIHHSYSSKKLFDGVNLTLHKGERVGLLGRNGAGKSTLMAIAEGVLRPDEGQRELQEGVRLGRLIQDLPSDRPGTILDVVTEAFGDDAATVAGLAKGELAHDSTSADFDTAWMQAQAAQREINRLGLDPDKAFSDCSGGQRRRVLLAQALVHDPDILLLDEPTNHLDIDSIQWLESFLVRDGRTLLFVTHDRAFLQQIATRIVELDRGQLRSWDCDYHTFLKRREAWLHEEEQRLARLDKRIASEEIWEKKGVEARRTKSVGRLRALEALRKERAEQRARLGNANIQIQEAERTGRIVAELKDVHFGYDDGPTIVQGLSTLILRGDRIGIVGPNGIGKTTLARILLGELTPDAGSVKTGTNLEIVYFDQRRDQLDLNATVARNVADENDRVTVNGRTRHVHGYLRDFLFTDERARVQARFLSGGERNRLLLAKLFLKPANVLVLDEPTNDLDAETLDLLEERVAEFPGTVLLISHDRAFLDAVATNTLFAEGEGKWTLYAGGYSDARAQQQAATTPASTDTHKAAEDATQQSAKEAYRARQRAKRPRKLSYKEKRELEGMENHIADLENQLDSVNATLADPDFYVERAHEAADLAEQAKDLESQLDAAFERWEMLEAIKDGTYEEPA